MDILNICRVVYSYRLSDKTPVITKTISSNIASTKIIRQRIIVEKFVSRQKASKFDVLIYTILIKNIFEFNIKRVFFQDIIPSGTKFIENSVAINDMIIRGLNPEKGFIIGKLFAKNEVKVSFKVLIICLDKYIKNKSDIVYDYIYNIEKEALRVRKQSNKVITERKKSKYKEVLINDIIKTCIKIDKIIKVDYDIELIDTKIISCNCEGFYKVLVLGKIVYRVFYLSQGHLKCLQKISGFSTIIVMPIGVSYLKKIDIKTKVEYIYSYIISINKIFISSILLLYY